MASTDPSVVYGRCRKLVSTLEWQLQQLEEGAQQPNTEAEARASIAQNVNLLFSEVHTLERVVDDYPAEKRQTWLRWV